MTEPTITEILDNLAKAIENRDKSRDEESAITYWAEELKAVTRMLQEASDGGQKK